MQNLDLLSLPMYLVRKREAAIGVGEKGHGLGHSIQVERAIEVGEELARLAFLVQQFRLQLFGVDDQQHEIGLAVIKTVCGSDDLTNGRAMDETFGFETVGPVNALVQSLLPGFVGGIELFLCGMVVAIRLTNPICGV